MSRTCWCGQPILGQRRKFCSDACSYRFHNTNIAAREREQDDVIPVYQDDAPAELTLKQLRERNKHLARVGRRICEKHQSTALPLTTEYFYANKNYADGMDRVCKNCRKQRCVERARERYQADAAFRARRAEFQRQDRERHIEARRKRNCLNTRRFRARKLAERYQQLVGHAS